LAGADRHPWAVAEANWTYRQLGISGHAVQADISRVKLSARRGAGIIAAYTINELSDPVREEMLARLLHAGARGAVILVVEPIARRLAPWWSRWEEAFAAAGGQAAEWRFPAELPDRQRTLARAAGLTARELTARSLLIPHRA
nr:hypothetical protein [Chloroflexota bacterium]